MTIVTEITIPLYFVQCASLVLVAWYLATLVAFINRGTHEKTWIWIVLGVLTVLISWNAIAVCISNGLFFVRDFGTLKNLAQLPFYLKSSIFVCGLMNNIVQASYVTFIVRLWHRLAPRWALYIALFFAISAIGSSAGHHRPVSCPVTSS